MRSVSRYTLALLLSSNIAVPFDMFVIPLAKILYWENFCLYSGIRERKFTSYTIHVGIAGYFGLFTTVPCIAKTVLSHNNLIFVST